MDLFEARVKLERLAEDAGVVSGARKARFIFEHYTGLSKEDLYRFGNEYQLQGWKYAQMVQAIRRLSSGVPVQLILGYTHFYENIFLCRKGVLIPRPETETLVDTTLTELDKLDGKCRVLDLFTGSGIVAISLAKARPGHQCYGSDISRKAVNLAKENSTRLDADVNWRIGDMFAPFADEANGFDIICANPPYIPTSELKSLPLDVRIGDPKGGLDGGRDGLKYHRRLAGEVEDWIKPGGCLIVEMGYNQRKQVKALYKPGKVEIVKDLWRKDRVYIVRY